MEDGEGVVVRADYANCGIIGTQFPYIGRCCVTRAGIFVPEYESICPYCSAMTFPPNSSSLETVTFFECSSLGYVRRTTDAQTLETDDGSEIPRK